MALFDQWPYVNIHDLNTDWLVKAVKAVKEKTDTIDDSVERARDSAANAKTSEDNAKASEDNAKASEDAAKDYYDMTSVLVGKPLSAETLADMTDTTTIYVYTGSEPGMSAGDWYYYDGANWVSGGIWGAEGSMNSNARNILQYILERVAFTEPGMQVYVDALYQALAPASSVPTTFTITNALDHVVTNNTATGADSGDSYTATLTAVTGYILGTVTVSMGGTDITSAAYNNGVITIASITGNVVITATAVLEVPDTYQKVEYIATTNNAYINTGVTLTNASARVQARIYPTTNTNNSNPWAIRNGISTGNVSWSAIVFGNGAKFSMTTGNGGGGFVVDSTFASLTNNIIDIDTSLSAGNSATADMSLTITMNNTTETITGSGLSYDNSIAPVCVFGNNQYSQAYAQFKGRVYSFKMWNNNVLVADLRPVYRIADSVIGMYDVVSQTFKTNAGSGSFSKGSDI